MAGKKHKMFFNFFEKVKKARPAKQPQEKISFGSMGQQQEEINFFPIEPPKEEANLSSTESPIKSYEMKFRSCRGALEQIQKLSSLSKTEGTTEEKEEELTYRTKLEIIKSISSVILEMVGDVEAKK